MCTQAHTVHFVRMITQIMADQLQIVVVNSTAAILQLWRRYTLTPGSPAALAGRPTKGQVSSATVGCEAQHEYRCMLKGQALLPMMFRSIHYDGKPSEFHNLRTVAQQAWDMLRDHGLRGSSTSDYIPPSSEYAPCHQIADAQ